MSGTIIGDRQAVKTIKERHGSDFFKKIGAMGGKAHNKGGFKDRELARRAGAIGGAKSRRGKAVDKS